MSRAAPPGSLLALTALIGAIAVAVAVHGGSATTVTLLLGLGIGAAAARAALVWADAHHRHLFPLTLEKRAALLLVGFGSAGAVAAVAARWQAFWLAIALAGLVVLALSWDRAVDHEPLNGRRDDTPTRGSGK